jgi:hypothetical protein
MSHADKNRTYFHCEHEVLKVKSQAFFILWRLRDRTPQLGTAEVFQWLQIPLDTSVPAREASLPDIFWVFGICCGFTRGQADSRPESTTKSEGPLFLKG